MLVAGLVVSVPPEMFAVVPAPEDPSLTHVVTKVSTVLPALTAPVTCIYSPEYGAELVILNNVVAAAPDTRVYHPVVEAFVLIVTPTSLPPDRVKPL